MSVVWACIQTALILPDTFQTTALHRQDLDEKDNMPEDIQGPRIQQVNTK